MRTALAILALALPMAAFAAKPVVRTSIPKAFHGDWALDGRACAPGPSDSGNMRLTAKRVINFESLGAVKRVEVLDPQTIRVSSRVSHSGATFGSTEMLSLSTDGKQLTIGEMSDMSVYKRCAA